MIICKNYANWMIRRVHCRLLKPVVFCQIVLQVLALVKWLPHLSSIADIGSERTATPDGEFSGWPPNEVLTAHTEWLPSVQLTHAVPPVHRGLWVLVVVWQSWLSGRALAAQARCPGFDTQWLPAFFTFLHFHLITNFVYFQLEARCSILKCSLKSWSSGEILRITQYSKLPWCIFHLKQNQHLAQTITVDSCV